MTPLDKLDQYAQGKLSPSDRKKVERMLAVIKKHPKYFGGLENSLKTGRDYGYKGKNFYDDLMDAELGDLSRTGATYNLSLLRANKDAMKKASETLRDNGIPGLKYLDGNSRGSGKGTRNYVTWDQDVLNRSKVKK